MMQKPEAGRRIVSWGAYAVMKTVAVGMSGSVFACGLAILLLLGKLPYTAQINAAWEQAGNEETNGEYFTFTSNDALLFIFISLFLLMFVAFLLKRQSQKIWKSVNSTQPINYANTADLPAPDSLVRASQEPTQAQESVLLRAASGEAQEAAGQLLRATAGGQEEV